MSILETRYRRLLAWFPRDHRDVHEEEMIGVLMAGARSEQQRPDPRDAASLVAGGLSLRLRRAAKASTNGWPDAISAAGVAGALLSMLWLVGFNAYFWRFSLDPTAAVSVLATVGTVAAAAANRRRLAAAAAWLALLAPIGSIILARGVSGSTGLNLSAWSFLALFTATALTLTREPKRGFALLGRRSIVGVALVGLSLGCSWLALWFSPPLVGLVEVLPLLLAVVVAADLLRSPAGRRVVALLLVPTLIAGAWVTGIAGPSMLADTVALVMSAVVLLAVAARQLRRRVSGAAK